MPLVAATVLSIGLDSDNNSPIVVLGETGGNRALPIWIGSSEALAINLALEGVSLERPLTHDLMKSILDALQATVERIVITELKNNTFFAQIIIRAGEKILAIDARPSDSIALALRTKSPIYIEEEVLQGHGVPKPADKTQDDLADRLKKIRPEDFGKFTL